MRWDHANIFLKILEEPPETATLILLATNPYLLLPTIRSRCLQFLFAPLRSAAGGRDPAASAPNCPPRERKMAAQLAEGSPGVALALDLAEAVELRQAVLRRARGGGRARVPRRILFAQTAQLAKGQKVPFETVLELFYSFLTDLLELSAGCADPVLRNPTLGKELASLSKRVDPAVGGAGRGSARRIGGRLRRNINRQLGLDAVAMSLAGRSGKITRMRKVSRN